jgi:DNA-binding transcriptional ArsR family regulator
VDTLFAEREEELFVKTFQIDSTMTSVRDLKPQMTLKLRFAEFSGYLAIALGVLLVLALAIYLLIRHLHKRGKHLSDLFKPAPAPPAHIVAIDALVKLRDEKLWQRNKHKLYYSGLSDILRTYLAGRFDVGAMEMTTDEIVEALRTIDIEQKSKMELLSVLRDADLVKFAKAEPEAEENEVAYDKAFYFVENTKPVERVEEQEDEPTKNNKEEQR